PAHLPLRASLLLHDTSTTHTYLLSLHDALPISSLTCFPIHQGLAYTSGMSRATREPTFSLATKDNGASTCSIRWAGTALEHVEADRKSTRLNSSHVAISYAGFCLKKKKLARLGA